MKFLLELPLKLLAESAHYFSDRLCHWVPSHSLLQYVRSFLLLTSFLVYGVFEVAHLLVKTMIEPQSLFLNASLPREVSSVQPVPAPIDSLEAEVAAVDSHSIVSLHSSSSCSRLGSEKEESCDDGLSWRRRSSSVYSPCSLFFLSKEQASAKQVKDQAKNLQSVTLKVS